MDHWGDPWADDADADANANAKSPKKEPATTPRPALSAAPVLLTGFLDDAQWGFEDEDEDEDETRITGVHEKRSFELDDGEGWGRVLSEASDSATTIQPDDTDTDTPERISTDLANAVQPDDDLSTRSSTSPSDASHTEAPPESPRTSFEDERIAGKAPEASAMSVPEEEEEEEEEEVEPGEVVEGSTPEPKPVENEGAEFGDFEEDAPDKSASRDEERMPSITAPAGIGRLDHDLSLMEQLFPPSKPSAALPEAPDDPIYTTSSRKTWYRLTRKQTMREHNGGNDHDNYVRVTWANSHIRSEASKIVGRWATEDRMTGRGQAAGAFFYWDQPPASNTHLRKKSIAPVASPSWPAKQNVQPLSTNVPAAFNWSSSPLASHDPWREDNPGSRSASSPVVTTPIAVSLVRKEQGRSVSVDLTPQPPVQTAHRRTATLKETVPTHPTPALPTQRIPGDSDPWENSSVLDTNPHTKITIATHPTIEDEDDDWGEMVESPAVSTPTLTADFSQNSSRNHTLSTPSATPESIKSSPFQTPASRHASPIVRLKGIVSPTSAIFKFNSFMPTGADVEPIGQGILKPSTKPIDLMPEKMGAVSKPASRTETTTKDESTEPATNTEESAGLSSFSPSTIQPETSGLDDFSVFESSTSRASPGPIQSLTPTITPSEGFTNSSTPEPPPPAPAPSAAEPWSDADFSIFESALPAAHSTPQTQRSPDPSDPWSIFEAPAPSAAPFSRPPPRAATPPPKQPLTSATNSVQRRKAEEDEIIQSIIFGLPNLAYMLT